MTDNEIIKGFEDFINRLCGDISSLSVADRILLQDAFRLMLRQKTEIDKKDTEIDILIRKKESLMDEISELKAEIEMLKSCNNVCVEAMGEQEIELATAKTEAIKEFWDKAKQKKQWDVDIPDYIFIADGDNLLKEMTEQKE